jgi:hypothetical protein
VRVSTRKAHPKGNGRLITRDYAVGGTGMVGRLLPDEVERVSISGWANDGVDRSVSSHVYVTFGLDDNPADLDGLIAKLTLLRARQRRLENR